MSDSLTLFLAWLAGGTLGALFFVGLWWTVRRAMSATWPALWVLSSLFFRTGVTLSGFYLVAGSQPDRLLLCLLGFIMARFIVIRLTRSSPEAIHRLEREASHAP